MNIATISEAIEVLYGLNTGIVGRGNQRHERPHKPLLLLASLDLISLGQATPSRIPWSQELRARFSDYFALVGLQNDRNAPELPFYHLRSDAFWQPHILEGGSERVLQRPPTVTQARQNSVYASLAGGFPSFCTREEDRLILRRALVARYFPWAEPLIVKLFSVSDREPVQLLVAERTQETATEYRVAGRDSAFRRLVLRAYDFQCAACGLRIKLPEEDLTFVDGAHLIPFNVSGNDNPTNGLALCKNHHWAMDRFLIAPSPSGRWRTSSRLDSRRSSGEHDLVSLNDQPILPPHDDAYLPNPLSLEWRDSRLLA